MGDAVRVRRRHRGAVHPRRAHAFAACHGGRRSGREQHERVLRARSDERAQIAQDMHDVVTHRVSLMVLHATALEASEGRDALDIGKRIGTIGREALTNVRKHAGHAESAIVVRQTPRALHLSVANQRGVPVPGLPSGGHGLLGIAERIRQAAILAHRAGLLDPPQQAV